MFIATPPKVHAIAWTQINEANLEEWVDDNGLREIAEKEGTPLNGLFNTEGTQDRIVEFAGRHCYRSWEKGRGSAEYIENILIQRHGSVLEHASVTLAISGISRSCSHELVRHRAGMAWSQESQRYVDAKDIQFIMPVNLLGEENEGIQRAFQESCQRDLGAYLAFQELLKKQGVLGKKEINEACRESLPNAAETRLVMTGNLRAFRHFLELRGGEGTDAQIRRLALQILPVVKGLFPYCFHDMKEENGFITAEYKKV